MIDQRVLKLTPEFATYTIAKMGLWALTRTAAQGLAPDVRVNAIGPGPTLRGARQSERAFRRPAGRDGARARGIPGGDRRGARASSSTRRGSPGSSSPSTAASTWPGGPPMCWGLSSRNGARLSARAGLTFPPPSGRHKCRVDSVNDSRNLLLLTRKCVAITRRCHICLKFDQTDETTLVLQGNCAAAAKFCTRVIHRYSWTGLHLNSVAVPGSAGENRAWATASTIDARTTGLRLRRGGRGEGPGAHRATW